MNDRYRQVAAFRALPRTTDGYFHRHEPRRAAHVAYTRRNPGPEGAKPRALEPVPCARALCNCSFSSPSGVPTGCLVRFATRNPCHFRSEAMSWHQMKALDLVHFEREHPLSVRDWLAATRELLNRGARPVSVFSQQTNGDNRVWIAVAPASGAQLCLTNTVFAAKEPRAYAPPSYDISSMNYFRCALSEQTARDPPNHPLPTPARP